MNTILISYDLQRPGKNYPELWNHLKSYGTWAKPVESVWLLKTSLSAAEVRDAAKLHVDANDKLIVIDITDRNWALKNIDTDVATWIKNNL
jgi:hypothetical protein